MKKLTSVLLCIFLIFLTGCSSTNYRWGNKEIVQKDGSYSYPLYCSKYPSFRNFHLEDYDLYWTVDHTVGIDTKVSAIHCSNETENFYIFQVGNMFCKYDYSEFYMGVSNCRSLRIKNKIYYAFTMYRFLSSGGFYIVDLLLFEPGAEPKIYVLTIEDVFDVVSEKVSCSYDHVQNKAMMQDSHQLHAVSVDCAGTLFDGGSVQKEVRGVALYADLGHNDKSTCWYYQIQKNAIILSVSAYVNFYEEPYCFLHYSELYDYIGEVSVPVTFENEAFHLGDAEFKSYEA